MPSSGSLQAFMSQAFSSASRSTALQPLVWLSALLIFGFLIALRYDLPTWGVVFLACLAAVAIVIFLGSYIYFMFKNPDALRSEKYTLSKMAIEKNLIGDDVSGLIEVMPEKSTPTQNALPQAEENNQ